MKAIGYISTAVFTIVIGSIWRGYVLSVLWAWFIVTTFGAKPISIAAAIGVSCVVSILTFHHRATPKDERSAAEQMLETVVVTFFGPAFSLAFGAVVKAFL